MVTPNDLQILKLMCEWRSRQDVAVLQQPWDRSLRPALLRGQVRLVLNRNADLRMIGGRNEMDAEYDVGFDDDGRCARHRIGRPDTTHLASAYIAIVVDDTQALACPSDSTRPSW